MIINSSWLATSSVPSAIAYLASFAVLLAGSITDLKTREVPDFVNYGFIISGASLSLLFSIIYSDYSFIINSAIGLLVFFGIAYIMFYAGQWGGGDSKMLMGIAAMIGIDIFFRKEQFLLGFLINVLLVGAVYGLIWSAFLAFKNRKTFRKELEKILSQNNVVRIKRILLIAMLALSALLFAAYEKSFFDKKGFFLLLSLAFLVLTTFYLWVFVRAIEKSAMYKLVEPSILTEGDWIVNDVYVGGKYVCGPKDLGIEKNQIKKLVDFHKRGKVGKILIKEGIPFVPSFLIAFAVTLFFGNAMMWIV